MENNYNTNFPLEWQKTLMILNPRGVEITTLILKGGKSKLPKDFYCAIYLRVGISQLILCEPENLALYSRNNSFFKYYCINDGNIFIYKPYNKSVIIRIIQKLKEYFMPEKYILKYFTVQTI